MGKGIKYEMKNCYEVDWGTSKIPLLKVGLAHCYPCRGNVLDENKLNLLIYLKNNYFLVSLFWWNPDIKMKQYTVFSTLEFTVLSHPNDIYFTMLVQDHKQ